MFYDHLSALTLAYTGSMRRIDEDEVGFKEKPEDFIPTLPFLGRLTREVQVRQV